MEKITSGHLLYSEYLTLLEDCQQNSEAGITYYHNDIWVNQSGSITFSIWKTTKAGMVVVVSFCNDRQIRIFTQGKIFFLNEIGYNFESLQEETEQSIQGKVHHAYMMKGLSRYLQNNEDVRGFDLYLKSYDGRISQRGNEMSVRNVSTEDFDNDNKVILDNLLSAGIIHVAERDTASVSGYIIPAGCFLWLINSWDGKYVLFEQRNKVLTEKERNF